MEWVKINERIPSLSDRSVLVHFENGSMETVHVEDYFKDITNGRDSEGNLRYTKWYLNHDPALTHWMELEAPKDLSLVELIDDKPDLFKQMGIAANPMNDLKDLFEGLNPNKP